MALWPIVHLCVILTLGKSFIAGPLTRYYSERHEIEHENRQMSFTVQNYAFYQITIG